MLFDSAVGLPGDMVTSSGGLARFRRLVMRPVEGFATSEGSGPQSISRLEYSPPRLRLELGDVSTRWDVLARRDGSWEPNLGGDGWPVLVFENVRGFRVLDEGDLLEFWDAGFTGDKGWVWRVDVGGWLDAESKRDGFTSKHDDSWTEYLVTTGWECVSVISSHAPVAINSE